MDYDSLLITDWSGVYSNDILPVYRVDMQILMELGLIDDWLSQDEWGKLPVSNVKDLLTLYDHTVTPDEASRLFRKYFSGEIKENPPVVYENAGPALKAIRSNGTATAIVSSHGLPELLGEAIQYGISRYFTLISAGNVPKATRIKGMCKMLGIPPNRTFFKGDTVNDIRFAREAGVQPIAISHGYHTEDMLREELGKGQERSLFRDLYDVEERLPGLMEEHLRTA
ncbi:HAD family hydrolase [Candidatus Aenigmatarchaeota archaeon]